MPGMKHMKKATLKRPLLGLMAISSLALANDVPKVTELLRSGYEVKAAYQAPGRITQIHYLILQKGPSVYQCVTYESNTPLQRYYDYSNTYSCGEVGDLVPKS